MLLKLQKKYADQIKTTKEENEKNAKSANDIAEKYAKLAQGVDVNTNKNKFLSNEKYCYSFLMITNETKPTTAFLLLMKKDGCNQHKYPFFFVCYNTALRLYQLCTE